MIYLTQNDCVFVLTHLENEMIILFISCVSGRCLLLCRVPHGKNFINVDLETFVKQNVTFCICSSTTLLWKNCKLEWKVCEPKILGHKKSSHIFKFSLKFPLIQNPQNPSICPGGIFPLSSLYILLVREGWLVTCRRVGQVYFK